MAERITELIEANKRAYVNKIEAFPLKVIYPEEQVENHNKEDNNSFFFCGAVIDSHNHIIGIPNKYPRILEINPQTDLIEQWGNVVLPETKGWTGGCLAGDNLVYGFPRGSNSILIINTVRRELSYRKLNIEYMGEHHYGGILLNEKIIIQPPKLNTKLLCYDIENDKDYEIQINSLFYRNRLFYGGMSDLDGNGYFFPAGRFSRVCMVSRNGKPKLIGKIFRSAFFNSGALAADNNIYGFSSYGEGIIQINTNTKRTFILFPKMEGGHFGAKLGFNGKVYSIPGNSDYVLEFDVISKQITNRFPLPDCERGAKAKCAGGAIDEQGNIWCVPAMGHYIYKICFADVKETPSEALNKSPYFRSYY